MKHLRWMVVLSCILAVPLVWLVPNLTIVPKSNLRDFDAHEVARIETCMWRSYYAKAHWEVFKQVAELLRRQYHFSATRSYVGAYYAARAAVVFQRGHNRADYEQALPLLRQYYQMLNASNDHPFDQELAARRELGWWILHRERAYHPRGDLENALAELQAVIYQEPSANFRQHAAARAKAMTLRDDRAAEANKLAAVDWIKIESLLDESWMSLSRVVR
jgi:hypothetical protein